MIDIPNVDSWFVYIMDGEIYNLKIAYEAVVVSITRQALLFNSEFEKEELYRELTFKIKQTKERLVKTNFTDKTERLKFLDNLEMFLNRSLTFESASFKPFLKWTANKEILAEVFMQLKNLKGKDGKGCLDSSIEDIAIFLKQNFDVYQNTELSTIQGTLKKQSSKISSSSCSVKVEYNK